MGSVYPSAPVRAGGLCGLWYAIDQAGRLNRCRQRGRHDGAGLGAAGSTRQPRGARGGRADPQQIREELERLRQEFEAIRDSYGARLAALEAKLGGAPAADAPAASAGAAPSPARLPRPVRRPSSPARLRRRRALLPLQPQERRPRLPPVPSPRRRHLHHRHKEAAPSTCRPARPARVGRRERCRSTATAPRLSKIFNPDMAVIGNFVGAAGKNQIESDALARVARSRGLASRRSSTRMRRADFFLAASPEGLEIEEGFLTLTSLPGGLLAKVGKMKEQFGKVNTLHAHTLPWVDDPLVMTNLLGGEDGLEDSGVSVSKLILNPLFFLEATGEIYQGNSGGVFRHQRAKRRQLARTAARLPRPHRRHQPRHRHVVRRRAQRRGPRHPDAALRRRRDLPLPAAAARHLPPLPRADRAVWSHREQDIGDVSAFGMYVSGEYQFAQRWFAGGALRPVAARDRFAADRQGAVAGADVLAERVQPDTRAVPADALRRRRHGERAAVPVPLRHRRARRAHSF